MSCTACKEHHLSLCKAKTGEVEYVCRRSLDKKEMLPVGEAAAIVNSRIVRA